MICKLRICPSWAKRSTLRGREQTACGGFEVRGSGSANNPQGCHFSTLVVGFCHFPAGYFRPSIRPVFIRVRRQFRDRPTSLVWFRLRRFGGSEIEGHPSNFLTSRPNALGDRWTVVLTFTEGRFLGHNPAGVVRTAAFAVYKRRICHSAP